MQLTPHQHTAIYTHDRNLVVVAGAGSGKTRVLVERYLALLDAHPDWSLDSLVAITFTSKAAQEMRDRVRKTLEDRYRAATTAAEIGRWSALLSQMDSARIDTIHALCATILRANAAEARVDPGFEILDEVQGAILLDNTIDDVLRAMVQENHPALTLFNVYDESAVRSALFPLMGVDVPEPPANLLEHWRAQWQIDAQVTIEQLVQNPFFKEAAQWTPAIHPRHDKLYAIWLDARLQVETLLNEDAVEKRLAALRNLQEGVKLNVGSKTEWGGDEALKQAKDVLRFLRESAVETLKSIGDPPDFLDEQAAALLPHWYALVLRVQVAFQAAKERESVLDFDDLEKMARDLLVNNSSVRRRYRAEFKHVLVDEFQDTNSAQWDIVRALAEPAQPGSLFIVGDQKQSIYAFRGADVRVFGEAQLTIEQNGGQKIPLVESFRTHKPLVDGFNSVFAHLLIRENSYAVGFDDPMSAARAEAPHSTPSVELLLLDKEALLEGEGAETARRWEAYEIAERLHHLVNSQTPIFDKEKSEIRALRYGDIAILLQSMSNVTLYEEVFKARSLPFVTIAGRGYYDRQEVWDVRNLLTVLHNPADNLALASVLRSPMFSISDDALLALRLMRADSGTPLSLWDALAQPSRLIPTDEIAAITFARDTLYALHHIAGRVTISELLREALTHTGYLAVLSGLPDGARKRGNVEKLLDKAQTSGQVTLGAFEQYLRDLTTREVREGEAMLEEGNAVTLMTVHASKGLEFPVVVLVDTSWEMRGGRREILVHDAYGLACKVYNAEENKFVSAFTFRRTEQLRKLREEAERKRLLYVAATRAQDMLLISGSFGRRKDGSLTDTGLWLSWLLDIFDIRAVEAGEVLLNLGWGQIRFFAPAAPPAPEAFTQSVERERSLWDSREVQNGLPLAGEAEQPFLLRLIKRERAAFTRNLSATHIADLGAAKYEDYYKRKLRRNLLFDAPAENIEQVMERSPRVSARQLGDIVHDALHWWRFPNLANPAVDAILENVLQTKAWSLGIVNAEDRRYAVAEARKRLNRFRDTELYRRINTAQQVYRELPFIYQNERGTTIHGIIDVLFLEQDGAWSLADYKTSHVPTDAQSKRRLLEPHAQRYYLQVGVYAEAVRAQLGGITPRAYIHYLRYGQSVQVAETQWRPALEKLEDDIGSLMWDDEDA